MGKLGEAVTTVVVVVSIVFLVFGAPLLLVMGISSASCGRLEQRSGINTEYDWVTGCYVEVNGKMIPQDNWRGEYQQ